VTILSADNNQVSGLKRAIAGGKAYISVLPVSGVTVSLKHPTGHDDVLLLESGMSNPELVLELASRLAVVVNKPSGILADLNWANLTVTDLDVLVLLIRQMVMGDLIRTDVVCPNRVCMERFDISFRVSDYIEHHKPENPRGIKPSAKEGWFEYATANLSFRLPTAADQAAISYSANKELLLTERCVRPTHLPAKQLERIEKAMSALAPSLCHAIEGVCPECGTLAEIMFDPQQFCLTELRYQAALVYEDVCLLAKNLHWSEVDILSMPNPRRSQYREMLR
jgi:hypothetical protein